MTAKPIEIDLRRDLPKVRKQWAKLAALCPERPRRYDAPCAIGSMMPKARRERIEGQAARVRALCDEGSIVIPPDQVADAVWLQDAFDCGSVEIFEERLARVEAKYLARVGS